MNVRNQIKHGMLIALAGFVATGVQSEEAEKEESAIIQVGLDVVPADTLGDLLKNVEERRVVESREHVQRERDFLARRTNQQKMLDDAEAEKRREELRSERLETQFEENEIRIGNMSEQLDKRLGSLRELFGVLQQVAGDTRGVFEGSIVSAEYPGRGEPLGELAAKMGSATQLASIEEMSELWEALQQEMNRTGEISRFTTTVNRLDGIKEQRQVVRVGAFNIVGEDGYLNYDIDVGALVDLARQPSSEFQSTAEDLFSADRGDMVPLAIDPTRGALLSLEVEKATLGEQVGSIGKGFVDGQGGIMGAIIIWVGIVGVLLALWRLVDLSLVGRKVKQQRDNPDSPTDDNPLGRVLKVHEDIRGVDVETLDLKLGEAILQETPSITKFINIIQVISVVAPLMGLLGTVIGMIQTFQAITLFGTGDPKIMASGISIALMTTVLGLCVAIPTTLLHAILAQRSRSVTHVLEEQAQGLIAQHAEESGQSLG